MEVGTTAPTPRFALVSRDIEERKVGRAAAAATPSPTLPMTFGPIRTAGAWITGTRAALRIRTRVPALCAPARTLAGTRRVAAAHVGTTTVEAPAYAAETPIAALSQDKNPARARQMLRWHWLDAAQRDELARFVAAGADTPPPAWFAAEYEAARHYRTARSRRWMPSSAVLKQVGGSPDAVTWIAAECASIHEAIQAGRGTIALADWDTMSSEEHADVALLRVWKSMSEEERAKALQRVTYECARRLGWRKGYSSGFPGAPTPPATLREGAPMRTEARRALHAQEEERAWDAWQALSPEARRAEWDAAWRQRDRSVIYVDDAPTTRLLGAPAPRWYATPQRAGQLQYLPNVLVRLVRNHTPRGQPYDPWKATFRVPLDMHKHMLRSYLLAVYGLRTTWARSMVYRSPIVFSATKRRRVVGRGRTFKKVEVGLLEPFVFPGLTKDFLRTNMFAQEMMYEERRLMIKMTKGRRWRGHKSVADLTRALDNSFAAQNAGMPQESSSRPAQLLVPKGSVPTARHGNILSVLSERRAARQARLAQFIEEQRKK